MLVPSNSYSLLYNERHQNPCEVARILLDTCEADYYPLYPLGNSTSFPPVAFRQASLAACSMPVYNLIQGCAACQHEGRIETTRWAEYVARCMNGATTKDGFPLEIPSTTVIPEWAFVVGCGESLATSGESVDADFYSPFLGQLGVWSQHPACVR